MKVNQLTTEELYRLVLQKIFQDISQTEIVGGRVAMRDAALRAKALAENALTEGSLRAAGTTMLEPQYWNHND